MMIPQVTLGALVAWLLSTAPVQPAKDAALAPPRPGVSSVPAKAAPMAEIKTADDLLTALETADRDIRTITAQLNFITVAGKLEGHERQVRTGRVYFRNRAPAGTSETTPASDAHAAAAVRFDTLIVSQKAHDEKKTYVVNGQTVVERLEKEKLVNRYKLGPAERRQDPLKLGEGPFPLPFGQKRADVLQRFQAELVPAMEEVGDNLTLQAHLAQTYQLKLDPKPNSGISPKVKQVRVWYQKKDLLPVLARILRPDGGYDEFFLVGPKVNEPLPEGIFDTSIPPGWRVEEKERP